MSERFLAKVADENRFYLNNGKVLSSMDDLKFELKDMDEQTFNHHVNESKNDFHNWINTTVQDTELAGIIGDLTSRVEIHKAVTKRVSSLKRAVTLAHKPAKKPVKKAKTKKKRAAK